MDWYYPCGSGFVSAELVAGQPRLNDYGFRATSSRGGLSEAKLLLEILGLDSAEPVAGCDSLLNNSESHKAAGNTNTCLPQF